MAYNLGLDDEENNGLNIRPEILQYMQEKQANPTPQASINPSILQYFDEKRMQDAQAAASDNSQLAGLAKAGSMIGGAISGIKPDTAAFTQLEDNANAPVKQLQAQRQGILDKFGAEKNLCEGARLARAEDPNSQISKSYDTMLKGSGVDTTGMTSNEKAEIYKLVADKKTHEDALAAKTTAYAQMKHEKELADKNKKSQKYDEDFAKFSLVANNPSSRNAMGAAQSKIVAAQAVEAMLSAFKNKDGTDRYDEVTPQQAEEAVRALDRMISGAAPTLSGQEHLRPVTIMSTIQSTLQQLSNQPRGAQLGAFIRNFEDTIKREQQMATMQKKGYLKGLTAGHKHLVDADPERFNQIVEAATNDEALPFTAKVEGGVQPQEAVDPQLADYAKKYTGGDIAKAKLILDQRKGAASGSKL